MKKIFSLIFLNLSIVLISYFVAVLIKQIDDFLGWNHFLLQITFWVGILLVIIGLSLRMWATATFYKHNLKVLSLSPQSRFVEVGIYKYSRNPLYIGIILIYLGFTIYTGSYIGVISVILFALFWNWVASNEEKELADKFGGDYLAYKKRVPRWV